MRSWCERCGSDRDHAIPDSRCGRTAALYVGKPPEYRLLVYPLRAKSDYGWSNSIRHGRRRDEGTRRRNKASRASGRFARIGHIYYGHASVRTQATIAASTHPETWHFASGVPGAISSLPLLRAFPLPVWWLPVPVSLGLCSVAIKRGVPTGFQREVEYPAETFAAAAASPMKPRPL